MPQLSRNVSALDPVVTHSTLFVRKIGLLKFGFIIVTRVNIHYAASLVASAPTVDSSPKSQLLPVPTINLKQWHFDFETTFTYFIGFIFEEEALKRVQTSP